MGKVGLGVWAFANKNAKEQNNQAICRLQIFNSANDT